MSWARRCSRNGCSATSTSSSGTSSPARPSDEVRVETPLERREAELVQPGDLRRDGVLVEYVRERSSRQRASARRSSSAARAGSLLEQWPRRHERGARSAPRRVGRDRYEGCSRSDASPARPRHPPPRRAGGSPAASRRGTRASGGPSAGSSSQSTSTIRSVDTISFGCIKSSASSVRCIGDPIWRRDAVVDDLERPQHSEFQRPAHDSDATSLSLDLRKAGQCQRKGPFATLEASQ